MSFDIEAFIKEQSDKMIKVQKMIIDAENKSDRQIQLINSQSTDLQMIQNCKMMNKELTDIFGRPVNRFLVDSKKSARVGTN